MALVSPAEARAHLRAEPDYPADQFTLYLGAAEELAQQFLSRRVYPDAQAMAAAVLDGSAGTDPMVVNDAIKAAILLMMGHLQVNREDTAPVGIGQIPMGSRTLLWPFRVGLGV